MAKETPTRRTSKRMVMPGSTAPRSSQRLAAQIYSCTAAAPCNQSQAPTAAVPLAPSLPAPVAAASSSSRVTTTGCQASQEGPSEREIIAVFARMVQGVDLSTPISKSRPLFDRILEDLGKHFCMDFRQRRDVKLMISMAFCAKTTSFWQGPHIWQCLLSPRSSQRLAKIYSCTAIAPCNQSQAPTAAVPLAPTPPEPVAAASSSRVIATGCQASQEGPSKREIIAVLARMVQGVDLSTPISKRLPLFDRILEDLGKHFRMDFRQRRDVKLMISMALCKETTSFWQICSYTAAAPCNQSQAPTTAVLLAPTLPAPVVAASSRVTATGCQEGPSKREIIAVLARMVQGVDLSTSISSRRPLFERILEDLGKHFRMDFRQRRDVKLMLSLAFCKETASFWQGY